MAIMNCIDVSLQMLCLRKWFTTRFTFVIFVAFMNCVDVLLQTSCLRKRFTTRFTFLIFVAFVNSLNMLVYLYFATKFTCICNLCGLHELCGCVCSRLMHEKMIYHRACICNLCGLHELCGCGALSLLH